MPEYTDETETPPQEGAETPQRGEGDETPQDSGREDTMFISPDMLGGLDPQTINAGDILEFKVVGRTADGDIEVEYNRGDGGERRSGMDRIKSDLRQHMMGNSDAEGAY